MDITLEQRGVSPAIVPRSDYEQYWRDALEVLVARRIVNVEYQSDFVLVYPNQYVGSARSAGRRLSVKPKYPDLLLQLRRNFPRSKKDIPLEGFDPRGEYKRTEDLAVRFLTALSEVIGRGVPFSYEQRRYEGQSLAGSLNVGETIRRFASRNIHHQAVTLRSVKTTDAAFVDIVWCAAEALRDLDVLSVLEIQTLDTMLAAIGSKSVELSLSRASAAADRSMITYRDRLEISNLLLCCIDLFQHNRTECDIEAVIGSVTFAFTDADALWERAVNKAMQQSVSKRGWEARPHPLQHEKTTLFESGGPDIDPDVIVYDGAGSAIMPVDAKDSVRRTAGASDVYQVVAYARKLGAPAAALIYLATADDRVDEFGDAELSIFAAFVRPTGPDVLSRLVGVCDEIAERAEALLATGPIAERPLHQ